MPKSVGRNAIVSKNAVAIAAVRVSTISWSGETIDVTDRDSAGITTLLADLASQQITLSCDGVYSSPVLRDIAFTIASAKLLTDITFKFADGLVAADTITGNFMLVNYSEENPHDDATTFSCEFVSSGSWTLS